MTEITDEVKAEITDEVKAKITSRKKDAREGHRGRLKDKYLEHGLTKLTEAEMLELLLSFGTPRRDCKETARAMLKKFGTIRDVFEADPQQLSQIHGAGPANIVAIKFINDVAGKYLEQRLVGKTYLSSAEQVKAYLRHNMENLHKEVFKIIYLDNNQVIIQSEDLTSGTVGGAFVHSRELLERAMELRSSNLILVHNHPSGNPRPSDTDHHLTKRLVYAAYSAEIAVIDHLIIGEGGDYYSFKDAGIIAVYESEIRNFYSMLSQPPGGLLHEKDPANSSLIKWGKKIPKGNKVSKSSTKKCIQSKPGGIRESWSEDTWEPWMEDAAESWMEDIGESGSEDMGEPGLEDKK